ncbi:glycoside hydrolase family protein [Henriciella sp.]|uniref:glycoside hydrolase family protein n=1 Tax=Henriciella sp. TaxID=1968823 RepID=UPI00263A3751|nr:glycoside hydrolase family protein [Henriciella sp.]
MNIASLPSALIRGLFSARHERAQPEREPVRMSYNRTAMKKELRRDEGFVPHAYRDSEGLLTIGIGRLIDKSRGGRITEDEAFFLLNRDLDRFEAELDAKLPWWRTLDDVRQRVILNMAFNLGVGGLLKFEKMLAAVKAERWQDAAYEMLDSHWSRQVGARAERLSKMMRTGSV